jgi:ABC-type cobalamin/Fe3+-siderophores transport system ATPase subunit
MELNLKDFQGWPEARLTLEGFTVVVGPSNRGKSALARAAKAILRNGITEGQVRLGTKQARVSLSLPDHEIESTRPKRGSASYVVDGEEFGALGGNVPPVMKDWGYQPVEVNGVKIDPVFAGQFDAQFLLSSSPAETSAILNAFSSTERLDRGKKTLKGKVGEVDSEAKVLGGQISTLEEQVGLLNEQSVKAEAMRIRINERMAVARADQRRSQLLQTLHNALKCSALIQGQITAIDRGQRQVALALHALSRVVLLSKLDLVISQRLKGIIQLAALDEVEPKLNIALKAYLRLERIVRLHTGLQRQARNEIQLAALGKVQGALELALQRYKILVRLRALALADPTAAKAKAAQIHDIDLAPAQAKLKVLAGLLWLATWTSAVTTTQAELSSVQGTLDAVQREQLEAETAVHAWIEANRIVTCPKCSHEFILSAKDTDHEHHH